MKDKIALRSQRQILNIFVHDIWLQRQNTYLEFSLLSTNHMHYLWQIWTPSVKNRCDLEWKRKWKKSSVKIPVYDIFSTSIAYGVKIRANIQFNDMTLESKVKVTFTLTCIQLEVRTPLLFFWPRLFMLAHWFLRCVDYNESSRFFEKVY